MSFYSIGTFKIYNKHRNKPTYKIFLYLALYTFLIIFLSNRWNHYQYEKKQYKNLPLIFLITPTYYRPGQIPELIRLNQTLKDVKEIHWILVEDSEHKTNLVVTFLKSIKIKYTHLNVKTPADQKVPLDNPKLHWIHPRGVLQRNLGLKWIKHNYTNKLGSDIIYFMDDDNTYTPQLFEEMRYTKLVSVWPVGLVGGLLVEKPLVNPETRTITGFNSLWGLTRTFKLDMAAFAINAKQVYENPAIAIFDIMSQVGYMENDFLIKLGITLNDLEPKAELCTKVLVWHTKSWPAKLDQEIKLNKRGLRSDEGMILI